MKAGTCVVFLGPSLGLAEAKKCVAARFEPPARRGDIWRAIERRPRAIALIDGLFESVPSVCHQELLDAMDAGIAVFGASSMGALRASELDAFGMRGVGQVYTWLKEGTVEDDAEVALLHADAEHDFRPLSVPLVNVRALCLEAVRRRVVSAEVSERILETAQATHYRRRHWPDVIAEVPKLSDATRSRLLTLTRSPGVDVKAEDARECLGELRRSSARAGDVRTATVRASILRRRQRQEARRGEEAAGSGDDAMATDGTRRLLVAAWARSMGLRPDTSELARWQRHFEEAGADRGEARRFAEDAALDALAVRHAARLVPSGPEAHEGLRFQQLSSARARGSARNR